jgi:hypothetical protein
MLVGKLFSANSNSNVGVSMLPDRIIIKAYESYLRTHNAVVSWYEHKNPEPVIELLRKHRIALADIRIKKY